MQTGFSQRQGYKPVKQAIQLESMDSDLRTSLWNALDICFWQPLYRPGYSPLDPHNSKLRGICESLWANHFKRTLDSIGMDWSRTKQKIREHFFGCHWYEVYDFIEFMHRFDTGQSSGQFESLVNLYLEREVSAYRLMDGQIIPITNPVEISEIEEAVLGGIHSVSTHLQTSLSMLADRQDPDYRNSVKESISAVESQVLSSLNQTNGTLGELLKQVDRKTPLHPAFKDSFSKLYGYTSAEGGIRHALLDNSRQVTFEEAKFMLVACSAFVNYVRGTTRP